MSESVDWQDVLRAAGALNSFPKTIFGAFNKYRNSPSGTSKASDELANSVQAATLEMVYAQGAQQLLFACDHTLAIHRLFVTKSQLSYSPWTCARGVLESCSICVLLLDPATGSIERITRSLNLRLEGFQSVRKYLRRRTPTLAQGIDSQVQAKIAALRQECLPLGIAEKLNSKGQFLGFGRGVQSISNRIEEAFGASNDYSLLSACAHAEAWAILDLDPRSEPGLSPEWAMYLVTKPIEWAARSLWAYYRFFGWDLEEGTATLEREYNRAGLGHESRFWQ